MSFIIFVPQLNFPNYIAFLGRSDSLSEKLVLPKTTVHTVNSFKPSLRDRLTRQIRKCLIAVNDIKFHFGKYNICICAAIYRAFMSFALEHQQHYKLPGGNFIIYYSTTERKNQVHYSKRHKQMLIALLKVE